MLYEKKNISAVFKAVIVICAAVGVEMSLRLFSGNADYNMFNYFTNLSNIFVMLYFICALIWLIKNRKDKTKTTFCPIFKGMAMMSITLTFLIVVLVLHMGFTMNNTRGFSLFLLHYVVPVLTVLDWVLFDKKGQIKKYAPLLWTIPPIVYIVYIMIAARVGDGVGGMDGSRYPYPFLDTDMLGVRTVVLIIIAISILYIGLGYVYYAIDNKLSKKQK